MSASDDKDHLRKMLERLLGFDQNDEGAGLDVLDHLLTIENRTDLFEYLSQLLGDESVTMTEFVDNVGRYQRGEPLVGITTVTNNATTNKPGPAKTTTTTSTASSSTTTTTTTSTSKLTKLEVKPAAAPQSATTKAQKGVKSRVPAPSKNIVSNNNNNTNNKKKNNNNNNNTKKGAAASSSNPTSSNAVSSTTTSTTSTTTATTAAAGGPLEPVPPTPPARGKATIVCGCFGTRHPSLTNCLYCGRISCAREGYDYCPFCGFLVEQVMDDGSHANDPSWAQKERLLRFDKDFARRTTIVDDQGDFQAPSSGWLSQQEQEQAQRQQTEREHALSHRAKQTLSLAI